MGGDIEYTIAATTVHLLIYPQNANYSQMSNQIHVESSSSLSLLPGNSSDEEGLNFGRLIICSSFRVGTNQSGLILHSAQSIPDVGEVLLRINLDATSSFMPFKIVPIVTAPTIGLSRRAALNRSVVVTQVPSSMSTLRTLDLTGSDSIAPFRGARLMGWTRLELLSCFVS